MTILALSPDIPQALLATIAVRASVVLAAAWILNALLARAAASTRHAIWAAALGTLVLLPAASFVMPRWEIARDNTTLMPARNLAPALATSVSPSEAPSHPANAYPTAPDDAYGFPATPAPRTPLAVSLLVIAWGLGAAFGLGRLSAGWAAARRLIRRGTPVPDGAAKAVRALARDMGISREVRALVVDGISVPVNCGLVRPVILLPTSSAHEWSEERLHVVLLHELAHVRRWDYAALLAMEAARALYWMNPLVWLAAKRANVELERACDDEVLRAGTRSVDYAEHLYAIAAALAGGSTPSGALAMAAPSTLRARVGAILAASINRAPMKLRAVAWAAAGAIVVGIPLASMRLLGEGRDAAIMHRALGDLASPSAAVKSRAAFTLGTLRSADARATLIRTLDDPDPSVRGMAAWALGNTGNRADEPALIRALQDPDGDVREMALLALASLGDRDAVPAMTRLAADPEMGVRGVLTHALHEMGGPRAAAALAGMALHDPDNHVRDMAIYALRFTTGRGAVPTLIAALKDPNPMIRADAAENIASVPDSRALVPLADAARHDPVPQVRGASSYALGMLKDERAAEPLAEAMRDSVWNVRVAVAHALGMTPGSRAEDALIAATRDPVHQVRLTADGALSERAHH